MTHADPARYADDFVVLCRSEHAARSALGKLSEMLARLGLGLHPDKTRVVSFDQGFRFLGHLFVRSLVVASPQPATGSSTDSLLQALALRDERQSDQERAAEQERAAGLSAVTRVLYVLEKGRSLALRNHSLTVCEDDHEILAIGPGRVDRIEIGPAASFEAEALRAGILDGIPLHLVDGHGRAVGVCAPALTNRAGLHLAQAQVTLEHFQVDRLRSTARKMRHKKWRAFSLGVKTLWTPTRDWQPRGQWWPGGSITSGRCCDG